MSHLFSVSMGRELCKFKTEVEPLNIGPNNALRYNALKMTKNFGVLIDSVITRRTVRGDE